MYLWRETVDEMKGQPLEQERLKIVLVARRKERWPLNARIACCSARSKSSQNMEAML